MLPDNMTNLKAAVLYAASSLPGSTIRTQVAHGLQLGVRVGSAHPRYDLVDVVRVKLFEKLRIGLHYEPDLAVSFVNRLSVDLTELTHRIAWELQERKRPDKENSPWALLCYGINPEENEHIILTSLSGFLYNVSPDRSYVCVSLGDIINYSYFYVLGLIATGSELLTDDQ